MLLAAMGLPLLVALVVLRLDRAPDVRDGVSVVGGIALFGLVLAILQRFRGGDTLEFTAIEVVPGLPLAWSVEPLGMLFALVASSLWIVTTVYGVGYMRGHQEANQTRFFACFALAIAATMGIAFADNLFTLFVFYEVLTLSTYPLVTHHGDEEARKAGRLYLGILLTTSVGFLLLGIVATWFLAGTLQFTAGGILAGKASTPVLTGLLALFAFGTGKAALMPFHRWLPGAMVAPTPVSALLHAVAVVKAGVFTILKVVVYIFGLDLLTQTGASEWLMVVASITLLSASTVALTQDNLKARLAYSTISQLAYIVLGAALATPAAVLGGGMHIAMHAFGKITLFFCAGAIFVGAHKKNVSDMDGLGRAMPFTFAAFGVGSLSIIGLPPFGGSWSKWYLALGAAQADHAIYIGVLMLSSLLSIGYLFPVIIRAFFRPPPEGVTYDAVAEAPLLCVVPPMITAAGCFALFWFAPALRTLLLPLVGGAS
jgi:multicomponent Na+:H+ antiporter subunit D